MGHPEWNLLDKNELRIEGIGLGRQALDRSRAMVADRQRNLSLSDPAVCPR